MHRCRSSPVLLRHHRHHQIPSKSLHPHLPGPNHPTCTMLARMSSISPGSTSRYWGAWAARKASCAVDTQARHVRGETQGAGRWRGEGREKNASAKGWRDVWHLSPPCYSVATWRVCCVRQGCACRLCAPSPRIPTLRGMKPQLEALGPKPCSVTHQECGRNTLRTLSYCVLCTRWGISQKEIRIPFEGAFLECCTTRPGPPRYNMEIIDYSQRTCSAALYVPNLSRNMSHS